jgi:hypothetical protein
VNASPKGLLVPTILVAAACASAPAAPPRQRGAFALHYGPAPAEKALRWYSSFDVLVTHDPLPPDQVALLRAAGTRLVLYEWAVAFYETRATPWQRSLIGTTHVLNSTPLTGGAGSATAPAWYFDPGWAGHAHERAHEIAARLQAAGYDGVFFDTTTAANVHETARREYEARHAGEPYDAAFARFLRALRDAMPRGIIFTNQGYRSAEHYLPYADWDLTESLITRPRGDSWEVRPWDDRADPWNSIHFVMRTMIEPLAARYPRVRFAHLNYEDRHDGATIELARAVALLFGGEAYVSTGEPGSEENPVYFFNLGRPVANRIDLDHLSYRAFEQGVVAVTAASDTVTIEVCGRTLAIPRSAGTPRAHFFRHVRC